MIVDYMRWVVGVIEMSKPEVALHLIEEEHSAHRNDFLAELAMAPDKEAQFFLKRLVEKYGSEHLAVSYIARMFKDYASVVHTSALDDKVYPLDLIIALGIKGKTLTEATIKTIKATSGEYTYALHRGLIDFLHPNSAPQKEQRRIIENFYDHYTSFSKMLADSPDLVEHLKEHGFSTDGEFSPNVALQEFADRYELRSRDYTNGSNSPNKTMFKPRARVGANSAESETDHDPLLGGDRILQPSLRQSLIEFRAVQRFASAAQGHNVDLTDARYHQKMIGPPGTGKTTVTEDMAVFFHQLGIISKPQVHKTSGTKLIDEYLGNTAPNVREAFEKASGGILFIDEAYHLAMDEHYGPDAVNELLAQMEDNRHNTIVFIAGYEDEIERLLDCNDGLRDRFGGTIIFEHFTTDEFSQILTLKLKSKGLSITEDARAHFIERLLDHKERMGKKFGNARSLEVFLHNVITAHAVAWDTRTNGTKATSLFSRVNTDDLVLTIDDVRNAKPPSHIKDETRRRGIGFGADLSADAR